MTDKNREKHKHAISVLAHHFVAGGWHNRHQLEAGSSEHHFGHLPHKVQAEISDQISEISRRLDVKSAQIIAAQEFLEDEQ